MLGPIRECTIINYYERVQIHACRSILHVSRLAECCATTGSFRRDYINQIGAMPEGKLMY